jgi:hypothetical protein
MKENENEQIIGGMTTLLVPKDWTTKEQIARLKGLADYYTDIEFHIEDGMVFVLYTHGEVEGSMIVAINGDGETVNQYGWGTDGAEPMDFDEFMGMTKKVLESSSKK